MSKIGEQLFLRPTAAKLSTQLRYWENRLGRPAVESLEGAKRLFKTGYLTTIFLMGLFFAFNLFGLPLWGAGCAVLAQLVWWPAAGRAMYLLARTQRLIKHRYGLLGALRPPLTFRCLQSTNAFDTWLIAQRQPMETQKRPIR